MKNKLFLLFSSPSNEFETRLFIARYERYFTQSKRNSPLLLLASVVLTVYQIYLDSSLVIILAWQFMLIVITGIIYYIDYLQTHSPVIEKYYQILKTRIKYRLFFGLLVAAMFGGSSFILSSDVPLDHAQLYYIYLICLFAVILISNINFPEYYMAYGMIVMSLLYAHALTRLADHSEGFMVIASFMYPVGATMMTMKAIEMSKMAINEVALGLILKKQMHEMLELQQVIKHQSDHDELTGLANRRKFEETALEFERNSKALNSQFGVIYIDLDKFKPINDTYGHAYGDLVLQEMANRLSGCSRASDLVCRMGGDEFCILLKNVLDQNELTNIATSLEERLIEPFMINDIKFSVGASFGVATFPLDGNNIDELVSVADHQMYLKKHQKHTSDTV
ncbi:MAG: GGDEF domain-containing protein [Gammaproteobacteria bacterium]|nr:GGDEF domain-containing protein [Gammaproteobacteria bacterium]